MTQPMGWHPDPEGVPGRLRWWDGKQWTSNTRNEMAVPPPPPPSSKGNNRGCAVAVIAVVAVIVVIGIISAAAGGDDDDDSGGGGGAPTGQLSVPEQNTPERASDDFAIDVCHDAVKLKLKDPESADFRNEKVVSTTSTTWAIVGEVNANNSFGGKVGFTPFTCDATQTGDTVNARATLLE